MSGFTVESSPEPKSGKSWFKSQQAKVVGAGALGTGLTLGAVMIANRMTDDRLPKHSGEWAGKEVKVERKLFRAFRDARLAREKANRCFKSARKAKGAKSQNKAYEKAMRYWNEYLAAMEELDELLAKFEAKSSVIAKAGGAKPYSQGGRATKKGKVPVSHPAHRAPKAKAKAKDKDDLKAARQQFAAEVGEFGTIVAETKAQFAELAEALKAQPEAEVTTIVQPA